MPTLAIVIVNYNTPILAMDCLRSLADQVRALPGARVYLVDNASPDSSAVLLSGGIAAANFTDFVTLIPLPENLGYAAGNNSGIRPALQSRPDYILLLNPDTIVRPNALVTLLDFMQSHPKAGIAGSRLEYPDAQPQPSAFRFHTIASEFEQGIHLGLVSRVLSSRVVAPPPPDETTPTDWVAGACMIIRREVIDQIGLLDEAYFLYFEEVDFCLRAARQGWECYYVPSARVVHLVGQASGVTSADRQQRPLPAYWFNSRRLYFRKNHGRLKTFLANLAFTTGFSLYRLRCLLTFRPPNAPPHLLRDFVRYNFLVIQ